MVRDATVVHPDTIRQWHAVMPSIYSTIIFVFWYRVCCNFKPSLVECKEVMESRHDVPKTPGFGNFTDFLHRALVSQGIIEGEIEKLTNLE
jgi:hypothetical protein